MNSRSALYLSMLLAAVLGMPAAEAASISLTPASSSLPLGTTSTTLEVFMDFTGQPTVGGGIDLDLTGPISIASFVPSSYFTTVPDAAFTGFGTANADADFEIHFGNFAGLSGLNKLGDLNLNVLNSGTGNIAMAINSTFGSFYSTGSTVMQVALNGAQVNVVPLPAAGWLLAPAFAAIGWRRRRR